MPIKKRHPLHRRVKRVHIVKLEPSTHDAGAETSTDLILLHWLPICNSIRSRTERMEPEVWFRIVHVAQDANSSARSNIYRDQMVEIALEPKGVFENGNFGALGLRAPPSRVVPSLPPCKQARAPKTPRVVELLRKAIEWKALLESGQVATQADIACREGVTRARVTQIMGLLRLASEIQGKILALPDDFHSSSVTERILRPIGAVADQRNQVREFHRFLP